jgi:Fe(3+) dicitrate transport protein
MEMPAFGIDVSASFVSEMWEAVGNGDEPTPPPRTDPLFLLDATSYLQLFDDLRIYVRGENLTFTQAIVSRRPFGARPNRPFAIQVGLQLSI